VRDGSPPWALVAVGAAGAVYWWLPRAYFYADDFVHLYDAVNLPPLAFVLQPHGGHVYVVRNLVLGLTLALAGPRPEWFMATVLATHLLNVALLFVVIRRFTGSRSLACLGALLWGTAPDAVGAIGWYSAYGLVLATTVMLGVLASAGAYAGRAEAPTPRRVLAWVGLTWAGATCYGTGLAFSVVLPAVLALLVPSVWREARTRRVLLAAPIGAATIYFAVPAVHAWLDPLRSEASMLRFALLALWSGWSVGGMLETFAVLVGNGVTGLLVLGRRGVTGLEVPAAVLWLAGCALFLWRGTATERKRLLGFMFVATMAYGVVLVGRSFSYLLTAEPRYQYYAQAPLVVTMCLVAAHVVRLRSPMPRLQFAAVAVAAVLLVAVRGSLEADPTHVRPGRRSSVEFFERSVRDMASQQREGVALHLANEPLHVSLFPMSKLLWPGHVGLFCILHPDGNVAGRPVRFVEPDPEVLIGAAGGRCSGRVLVEAPDAGATAVPLPKQPPRRRAGRS